MKKLTMLLAAIAVVYLAVPIGADAQSGPVQGKTPVLNYLIAPDGGAVPMRGAATGEPIVSGTVTGTVTMQGARADGGLATPLLDMDRRQVVSVGAMPGPALGANLTTTAGAGFTIPAGAEYLICALASEVWLTFDGTTTATADAPAIPFFARQCRIVGPFAAQVVTSGILPAGAPVLAGSEVIAIPMTRPQ